MYNSNLSAKIGTLVQIRLKHAADIGSTGDFAKIRWVLLESYSLFAKNYIDVDFGQKRNICVHTHLLIIYNNICIYTMYIYTNLRYAVYSRPTSQTSAGAETFLRKVCEKWGGWVEVGKREGCREEGKSGKLGGGRRRGWDMAGEGHTTKQMVL